MKRVLKAMSIGGLALLACACMLLWAQTVSAAGSTNVVIIGGATPLDLTCAGNASAANVMGATGGGCLPVSGADLAGIVFTAMTPSGVSYAALGPFDTAVLNVASSAMACNTGVLTAQAKADLIAFVKDGKKLIIFDSECYPGPVDYSWMPFPFTTANPGARGAQGTLTIVEENTLSSKTLGDPYYIDAAHLGTATDAVGDMNVMTTFDPNWCIDMSGTNYLKVTGPVHTYAKYPAGTDKGLIIYNGLDQDYLYGSLNDAELRKVWVFELKQTFNPSNLPCGFTIVGITLTPASATNEIHTSHTLTATLTDLLGTPQPGVAVTFTVTGPNAGPTGQGTSDSNGQVTFTYTGTLVGQDKIKACFTNSAGNVVCSQEATKDWTLPPNLPPDCSKASPSISRIWPPNHQLVPISIVGVTDPDGDPITITVTGITQDEPVNGLGDGDFAPDGFGVGSSAPLVRAERSGLGNGRVYVLSFTADDLKGGTCTGSASICVPHDQGKKGRVCIDDGQNYDSTVTP
jgi:hypothetical protein